MTVPVSLAAEDIPDMQIMSCGAPDDSSVASGKVRENEKRRTTKGRDVEVAVVLQEERVGLGHGERNSERTKKHDRRDSEAGVGDDGGDGDLRGTHPGCSGAPVS